MWSFRVECGAELSGGWNEPGNYPGRPWIARRNRQQETAVMWGITAALREAEFGDTARARSLAASALPLALNQQIQALAAVALAQSGDAAQAEQLADQLARRFPLGTMINRYWIPTIRSSIEIHRGIQQKPLTCCSL